MMGKQRGKDRKAENRHKTLTLAHLGVLIGNDAASLRLVEKFLWVKIEAVAPTVLHCILDERKKQETV